MPDFFNVIEGLFSNITGFLYNFAYSFLVVLRNPVRGAARLNARFLDSRARQIGPITLLVMTAALTLGLSFLDGNTSMLWTAERFYRRGTMEPLYELGCLVLLPAVAVDALSRLIFRLQGKRRARSANLIRRAEYGVTFPVFLGLSLLTAANLASDLVGGLNEMAFYVILAAQPIFFIPVVPLFNARKGGRRYLVSVLLPIAFWGALLGAGWCFTEYGEGRTEWQENVQIVGMRCILNTTTHKVNVSVILESDMDTTVYADMLPSSGNLRRESGAFESFVPAAVTEGRLLPISPNSKSLLEFEAYSSSYPLPSPPPKVGYCGISLSLTRRLEPRLSAFDGRIFFHGYLLERN